MGDTLDQHLTEYIYKGVGDNRQLIAMVINGVHVFL